ncbi:MAG: mechanosensitive ion channel [Melioribacteraceae bacterium]|nr:mechanosensitive ion channel [Melioribacteraceae bacterium]
MIDDIKNWFDQYPLLKEIIELLGVLIMAVLSYIIVKRLLLKSVEKIVKRTRTRYDDILLNSNLIKRISFIAPLILLNQFSYLIPDFDTFLSNLSGALTALIIVLIIGSVLTSVNEIYESLAKHKQRPIKGYIQIIKLILYALGAIIIVGILTGQSIYELVAGIGALTAILILVFRDTILSFIASIQITSYDLVKVGDWIEVPSFGIDGDVMDIALHTIKVRNFDKTITTIPTHKLVEVSFKNWRGMQETGGRRIKRAIHIDLASVKFLSGELFERLSQISILKEYLSKKKSEIDEYNKTIAADPSHPVNGRRLTNIGTFRAYVKEYLKNRNDISKDLTFLVRQKEPGANGIPIEIYVFTTTTNWVEYEEIQSDIFDHLFAAVQQFDLKVFQVPSGYDVKSISAINNID